MNQVKVVCMGNLLSSNGRTGNADNRAGSIHSSQISVSPNDVIVTCDPGLHCLEYSWLLLDFPCLTSKKWIIQQAMQLLREASEGYYKHFDIKVFTTIEKFWKKSEAPFF